MPSLFLPCHPERSEGSVPVASVLAIQLRQTRSFVASLLRMTRVRWLREQVDAVTNRKSAVPPGRYAFRQKGSDHL